MIYQRTGQMLIRPLLFTTDASAYECAQRFYKEYPELKFEDDLVDYMKTGFVCIRPKLFVMAKVIDWSDKEKGTVERMWFCRIALGNLVELLTVIPFYLPRVAFCRNNRSDSMRICTIKRLCQLAVRQAKQKEKPIWAAAAAA